MKQNGRLEISNIKNYEGEIEKQRNLRLKNIISKNGRHESNHINNSIKWQRLSDWINNNQLYAIYKINTLESKTKVDGSKRMGNYISWK